MVLCPSRLCELTTHVWWEGTFILASDNQHHAKHRCNPAAGNTEKSLCLPHNVTQWKTDCWNLKEGGKKPLKMVKKKKDGQPNVLKWHFNYTRLFWALFSENISRLLWTVLSHGWQRFCDGQTLSFNSHRVQASDGDWSMEPARTWCLPTLTCPPRFQEPPLSVWTATSTPASAYRLWSSWRRVWRLLGWKLTWWASPWPTTPLTVANRDLLISQNSPLVRQTFL